MHSLTYAAFDARVNQLANGLLAGGVAAGHRVVVHLRNSPEFLLTWFALAKIGAVMVPSNTANTSVEMEHVLAFSGATSLVTEGELIGVFEPLWPVLPSLRCVFVTRAAPERPGALVRRWDDLWRGQPESLPAMPLFSDSLAQLIFTSGTTAKPKAVMLTHANCLWSGERASKQVRLAPGERNLTALPAFHVNAQSLSILPTLTVGGTIVLLESYSASRFWEQVRAHRANAVSFVPALLRTIAAQPPRSTDRDHAVRVVFYTINCTDKEKADFEDRFGVQLLNAYGLTEAMTIVTQAPLDGNRRWPSIGLPALDREVRIVDEGGREVPRGTVGELIVRGVPGRTIMKGYWDDPDATGLAIRDGWLYTGDQAWMDDTGYLYFFDRTKDVIKRAGENVSASEVEQALMQHAGVLECAVVAVPDALKDEAVKAFVVPRPGVSISVDELVAHCAGRLARFKVPQLIEFRESLPKTSIGKIEKKLLRGA